MRIIVKSTGEAIGEVITNHSMTIWEACELAGVDTDDYDVEADLTMDYRDPAAVTLGRRGGERQNRGQGQE